MNIFIDRDTFVPMVEVELIPKINGVLRPEYTIKTYMSIEAVQDASVMEKDNEIALVKERLIESFKDGTYAKDYQEAGVLA